MSNIIPDLKIGDRPDVQKISLGGKKKKSQDQTPPLRNVTQPGAEVPSPTPIGAAPPIAAISGSKGSQPWVARQQGSAWTSEALQGRQFSSVQSGLVRGTLAAGQKPLALPMGPVGKAGI